MNAEIYKRINGDWVVGDSGDDAPLLILSFKNELSALDDQTRERITIAAYIELTKELP